MNKKIICILLVLCLCGSTAASSLADQSDTGGESMTVSEEGISFIEGFEGFSENMYCNSSQWYIGYGTSCCEGEYPDGISQEEAEALLLEALAEYGDEINSFLDENGIALTQYQFDALLSFTYNLTTSWMASGNRIYDYLTVGIENYTNTEIVNAIGIWCHIKKEVNETLVTRRMAEASLFLYGDYGGDSLQYSYIIFDAEGGSIPHDIYFFESGKPYGELPEAKLSGSTFYGWYTNNGRKLACDDTAEENLRVYADWTGNAEAAADLSDVCEDDWFYTYVSDLCRNCVVSGYPDGTFRPDDTVTCGEAIKLILLAAGYGEQQPTSGHWASGYLALAVSEGLVDNNNITDLNTPISRLLIAQIAAKALGLSESDIETPFSDTSDSYVLSLYKYNIIEGTSEDDELRYKPENDISRAEISAVIWRINNTEIQKNQIQCGSYWVDILEDVPVFSYDDDSFYTADGVMCCDQAETLTGIDVSSYQGDIDWTKVKASGIDFAIIRVGFRGYTVGNLNADSYFEKNIQGALDAGLDVGVYFFSQAITETEAAEEAKFVLSRIEDYDITYPVVFDWEALGKTEARTYGLDTDTLCKCADTFCGMIEDAGYTPMIYFTSYIGYIKYDLSRMLDYEFWYARYSDTPSFYYDFDMWQYSSSGTVGGISGSVDMNICFADYR